MVALAAIDVGTRGRRPPPRAIKILLPVWGYSYVRQFLECGLPTLLSSGNIPAIAAELPTELVLLTSVDDQAFLQGHPTFARLAATCKTTIRPIDHLITNGNYSTTITLAYTEEVRAAGASMVDTCFFFLVSDYIVADGSLANALKRMLKGISAVVVGNFQAVREDALPWLQDQLTSQRHNLALNPRVLMRWALNHLHPATLANIVNLPFSHNSHTNRLFWRANSETILGRFYLMHMLCVRPEVTDFIIGASCDYSFIPEMCPSGNVETITDSDEFLVIELQPRRHEADFLRPGPLLPRALAKSLNDWTTLVHRQNVLREIIFHAGELPHDDLKEATAQLDKFVVQVARHLRRKPRPYRGHPYWRGAMAAFYDATGRRLDEQDWRYALGLPATEDPVTRWVLYRAKNALMGRPPHVLPWHPRWSDLQTVFGELEKFFADPTLRLLTISNEPTVFSLSLADSGERVHRMRGMPFLQSSTDRFIPLHGTFDLCLLEILETDLVYGDQYIERILPLMKNGGQIIVSIENRRAKELDKFGANVSFQGARLIVSGVLPTTVQFIPLNLCRGLARRGMVNLRLLMKRGPWIGIPAAIVGTGFVLILSLVGNLDTLRRRVSERGSKSSFVMRLIVSVAALPDRPPNQRSLNNSPDVATAGLTDSIYSEPATGTREPQYNRCVELKETIGLTSLGLMTNQVWYDDPRRLTFLLARYKFVAKMLEGHRSVGEIGCGDAFGTRVVLQSVSDVTVYDFDPLFIEDIRQRQDERWPLKAEIHNIVAGPLPRKHDALYSLDVLEHIDPANEHAYLANLCASLSDDGLLMIGTPSLESQTYASPPSKAGHINCKSGKELKALLEKYFTHVFLFSMNDEVVHTGFAPMAHYLFALCAKPTWHMSAVSFQEREGRPKHEVWPLFEICEQRDAGEFYVQVTYDGHMSQRVDGFKTVADAAHWIGSKTADYIDPNRSSTSHSEQ